MLIKAEKIISEGDVLRNKSDEEIFEIVRREMTGKIVDDCIQKGLVKIEVATEIHDDFGCLMKLRATMRAYNPDV